MSDDRDLEEQVKAIEEKLKLRLGVTEGMIAHCQAVAGQLKQAALHHGEQAHYDLQQHADTVRRAGLGGDPAAEQEYCRSLLDRHRMTQAYELAHRDERRFPDVTPAAPVEKSLHRLSAAERRRVYREGTVFDTPPSAPDDFQRRAYEPGELLPREIERDKDPRKVAYFQQLYGRLAPAEIDPVVLVRTAQGREVLDGHHRWLGARAAGRALHGVEIGEAALERLQAAGYTEMEAAYAVLAQAGEWDAADKVKSQYDGRPVRHRGYLAYERLQEGN